MKRLIIIFLAITLLSGCRKDQGYQDSGTIFGHDYRKCMCCGGWFICMEKDTMRFLTLPEGSTIKLDDGNYPVEVCLDWHYPDPQCLGDEIVVTRIALKK